MPKLKTTTNPALRSPCGRYRSQRGKAFTEQTLKDHLSNCPDCIHLRRRETDDSYDSHPFLDLDMSDESDGVYHATLSWFNNEW